MRRRVGCQRPLPRYRECAVNKYAPRPGVAWQHSRHIHAVIRSRVAANEWRRQLAADLSADLWVWMHAHNVKQCVLLIGRQVLGIAIQYFVSTGKKRVSEGR